MNLRTIRDETGTYIEIPRDRITFKSKEAEIIFDLTLENDELRLKNQELKEKVKKLSQWDINKDTRNSRQRVANAKLLKENQELKKHLKVPENCKLKTLEDYKSYYEDTTREQILEDSYIDYCAFVNLAHRYSELKKQLEKWEHHLKCSKEMLDIQAKKGNYDYDEYMLGLYNGMEYIISLFETREPNLISGKDIEFINDKSQQKEFIKYLEDEMKQLNPNDLTISKLNLKLDDIKFIQYLVYKEILQKYKEIIGDDR